MGFGCNSDTFTPEYPFLAVIPPFHGVIDQAISYLADDGLVGVADFYVSGKYDLPMRQMGWSRRFFWRYVGSVQ